ncbi:MAG TPA: hypothetical protein ENJ35_04165 [Gammaproteobacteria bacterium]|nr:hypothetical protein [Gammaproteobacteria bacterium]
MSNDTYGRGLYFFVGLSTDSKAPTQSPTYVTGSKPIVGQLAYETDLKVESIWSGTEWLQKSTNGAVLVADQSIGAGARNPSSTTKSYLVTREECSLTIVDVQTAITIGGGVANDTHLMGVIINVALTGTCVITGFEGSAGTAISITIPAATPAGFIDFKAAINSKGPLTVTCSNASDDNNVQILWKAA